MWLWTATPDSLFFLIPGTRLPKHLTQSFVSRVLEFHRTSTKTSKDHPVCNHRCQCRENHGIFKLHFTQRDKGLRRQQKNCLPLCTSSQPAPGRGTKAVSHWGAGPRLSGQVV